MMLRLDFVNTIKEKKKKEVEKEEVKKKVS